MTASMTGYGWGEAAGPQGLVTVEMRSVNHRFCEVAVRLPRSLFSLEDRLRRRAQARLARGRIDISVSLGRGPDSGGQPAARVDAVLALAYYKQLRELGEKLGIGADISLDLLSRLPEVVTLAEPVADPEALWPAVAEAADQALEELTAMRLREGQALAGDLAARVAELGALREQLAARAAVVPDLAFDRLRRRLTEWLPEETPGLDAGRLEAEAALLAERADVSEELLRLGSHLDQFAAVLEGAEPAGRKLDFLVQELNREINTIGSKAGDLDMTRLVLAAKAALEKMREQLQNVE